MRDGKIWRSAAVAVALLVLPGCAVWRSGGLVDRSQPIGGPCETLKLAGGPEDLAPDGAGGFFLSTSDWRARAGKAPMQRGRIYHLTRGPDGRWAPLDVTPAGPADFQPHGVDLFTAEDGARRLFVVNHPLAGPSRIEIFDLDGERLTDTGEGGAWDILNRPNDIAAFGRRSFFASNDHEIPRRAWFDPVPAELATDLLGLRNGYVVRVDGGRASIVAGPLALANGVALSPDRQRLYVAESALARIHIYEELHAPRLREVGTLKPGPAPDNIVVAPDGALWVGAHNNGTDILLHSTHPSHPSPGRVVRLTPAGERRVVYQSGRQPRPGGPESWSVSSGAPAGEDEVVVGAIFPHQVQICRRATEGPVSPR